MVYGEQLDPFAELKRNHEEYRVYDTHYESLGRADELFVDGADRPLYIGIKTGFLEARSVLVPMEVIRVNDKRRVIEVSADADQIRHAPTLEDREEISADLEARIHGYFGLPSPLTGEYHEAASGQADDSFAPDERIDIEPGERQGTHERFGESTPAHTNQEYGAPDYLSGGRSQESPSRSTGKGWARGTERIGAGNEAGDADHDPLTARARRLRR